MKSFIVAADGMVFTIETTFTEQAAKVSMLAAAMDFMDSIEGKKYLEENGGWFGWSDFLEVAEKDLCNKYGFQITGSSCMNILALDNEILKKAIPTRMFLLKSPITDVAVYDHDIDGIVAKAVRGSAYWWYNLEAVGEQLDSDLNRQVSMGGELSFTPYDCRPFLLDVKKAEEGIDTVLEQLKDRSRKA